MGTHTYQSRCFSLFLPLLPPPLPPPSSQLASPPLPAPTTLTVTLLLGSSLSLMSPELVMLSVPRRLLSGVTLLLPLVSLVSRLMLLPKPLSSKLAVVGSLPTQLLRLLSSSSKAVPLLILMLESSLTSRPSRLSVLFPFLPFQIFLFNENVDTLLNNRPM